MNNTNNKVNNSKGTFKRVCKYLKKYNGKIVLVILFIVLAVVFTTISTLLMQPIIDDFIAPMLTGTNTNFYLSGLLKQLIYLVGSSLLASLCLFCQYRIMVKIAAYTIKDMRNDIFSKLHKLPIKYFDQNAYGELMSRITNDLENLKNAINTCIDQFISGILNALIALVAMIIISPFLTIIVVLTTPIMLFVSFSIIKKTSSLFKLQQECLGDLNGYIEETISGQRVIKAFNHENESKKVFSKRNQRLRKEGFKANAYSGAIMPITNSINNICTSIIYVIAGIMVLNGKMTIGLILTFSRFRSSFSSPLNEIAQNIPTLQSGLAGAGRMFEIIDQKEEFSDSLKKPNLSKVKGLVEFKNVSFAYDTKLVLKNVSFKANPGEIVAIVGETGAGKTTIINLLTRFYDINNGEILIDGKNIKDVNSNSLREALGIVLQDTVLFSDTVKENIRFGNLKATDKDIKKAAIMAKADSFITKLPKKYDTVLNEETSNISVGQKQLINISRVILNNPKILILDEATSNVDTRTEVQIRKAMNTLMKGRTCFVIAHRLSTIRNANKILVINNGCLVESGTHNELIKKKGRYYEMYTGMFEME